MTWKDRGMARVANRKKTLVTVLRLSASVVMLVVLIVRAPDFQFSDLVPDWSWSSGLWLTAAAILTLAGIVLSALRWQKVLDALQVPTSLPRLVRHYMAGQFVSNALPTTIGGDVLRVMRLSKDTGQSPATFASVVLERLTGWLVLPVITIVGFTVNPGLRHLGTATRIALGVAIVTLALLVGILVAAGSARVGGRLASNEGWQRFAAAVHLGIKRLRSHPSAALHVLGAGFAYQLILVLAAVAAAQSLGLRAAGLTALLAFFPAVLIVQVLPFGINGLGLRESAFVVFLTPLGVAQADAVALGLLLFVLNLGVSLLGAPAFAAGGGAPKESGDPLPDSLAA